MGKVEIVLPKLGESIMEATVLSWLKKEGDQVEEEESIVEVATDKVDTEVPSSYAGKIDKILVKEGEVAKVGSALAILITEGEIEEEKAPDSTPETEGKSQESATKKEVEEEPEVEEKPAPVMSASSPATVQKAPQSATVEDDRFYSPLVRNIAREENISAGELAAIKGTGKAGRVTKHDMLTYLENRQASPTPAAANGLQQGQMDRPPMPDIKMDTRQGSADEVIEMDRMRRMIADRMVDSKRISPHVTSFVEADVTNLVFWRNRVKQQFHEREGDALTFTPIFIEAVVKAIRDYPMINISVEDNKIIKKASINIGMAVALPSGNLIVPVIHNADRLNLVGLTKRVNDLARRARSNKLKPDELSGGTYTVSNVGSFGNVMGTPIIMQPQVGIMALGAVVKKPAVVETPAGDAIGIRHKMFLSHSYDHRVVDGSLGGMFVRRVADYLEKFDLNREV